MAWPLTMPHSTAEEWRENYLLPPHEKKWQPDPMEIRTAFHQVAGEPGDMERPLWAQLKFKKWANK